MPRSGSLEAIAYMNIHTFSHINLQTLDQAVDLVRVNKLADGSREAAFVRAYPALMEAARATQRVEDAFLLTATFAHGWMPASLRLDPRHLDAAVRAFGLARSAKAEFSLPGVDAIAACLQSLVAASKVLHFAAPAVYPTWDARIERFRRGQAPTDYHMAQTANYAAYVRDIHDVKQEDGFLGFHLDYCMNYQERLRQLAIPPYPLTDMRVIESAVCEIIIAQGGHT